jgi:hypothetical protein
MNSTDEAILTFAEAFSRLGDRKYRDLYVEALASIVRMAKAEERYAAQIGQEADAPPCWPVTPADDVLTLH